MALRCGVVATMHLPKVRRGSVEGSVEMPGGVITCTFRPMHSVQYLLYILTGEGGVEVPSRAVWMPAHWNLACCGRTEPTPASSLHSLALELHKRMLIAR